MPSDCYTCSYKSLARRVIDDFRTLSTLLGLIDDETRDGWLRIVEAHHREFLAIDAKQRQETEEAPTLVDGYCRRWE